MFPSSPSDSVSNETVPKIAPDLRTPEINEKRQSKTEQRNSKLTQTNFPEICDSSSSISKKEILSKCVRREADFSALKSHVKCELSDKIRKIESLISGASNGYLCQSCENMKGNLSFLQKELLAKNEFIKSLLETQSAILNALSNSTSKLVSLSSSLDCSFGEEDMKNKADKDKHKISQSQQKQEKNASKLYIRNLNLSIKVIDLVKLFGLNTTKCLRESCSLNMPMNDKTGQSKGNAFVSAPKHVCDELLKLNEVKFYGCQIKIEEAKSARVQTIDASSPAKNQPVVMNKNTEKQNSLQNVPLVPGKRNYCEATLPRQSLQNTLIFTDSIPKGIRMYEFNSLLRNGKAQMLNFLGSSSKQM